MYHFGNLEPGDYLLQEHQPVNLTSGTNSFVSPVVLSGNDQATIAIPIAGGIDRLDNNFAERSLTTPFISMYDLLDSQFQRSALLLSTNGTSSWSAFLGAGWDNYSNPRFDLLTMTLTVTDGSGSDRSVNLMTNDPARHGRTHMDRLMVRQNGDDQVIRLSGSAADFFTNGAGEGEGDLADVQAPNSVEMYAHAVDQIFGDMA